MVGAEIGKAVADVGVAVVASRIDYHHSRSSRIEQTAQQEDAGVGQAEERSIANCKFRNQAADRDRGLRWRTSTKNSPPGEVVEGEDRAAKGVVEDCKIGRAHV